MLLLQLNPKTLDGANTGEITATISDNYLDKLADITDTNSKTHKLSITVKVMTLLSQLKEQLMLQ